MVHIVDYDAGNQTSVKRALDYLGVEAVITPDAETVRKAERLIFPGVGHAHSAMETLKEHGLDEALKEAFHQGTPILGICVGCQILLSRSDETDLPCLDLIDGACHRFQPSDHALKVPHMGWNALSIAREHEILKDIQPGDEVYFVHSYYPAPVDTAAVYATCEYDMPFAAAIGYKNLFATQFHAEKSGPIGLQIIKNFTEWDGTAC